ncbi:MAG TPA: arsenite methyltransferase [Thermoanaerobaculia bacterium]|jgi:SAM-dependent methyltransferase|nr:arsenite methyltransferase [Thermoanaerobaculia bacterium]
MDSKQEATNTAVGVEVGTGCCNPLAVGAAGDSAAVREAVRRRYAAAAREVETGQPGCACGCADPVTADLYAQGETAGLPATAVQASLGCGNPVALAELRAGEVVLDLGSGAGLDVLLSARRVGPGGKAYGLDMTDEMLALARKNQQATGVTNVEFLKGHLEEVPLPDGSVDVVLSNCVVNLSTDKDRVFGEAFRVLRPGGRLAIADIVVEGEVPATLRRAIELWSGCLAGALEVEECRQKLGAAGFTDVEIEITRVYGPEALGEEGQRLLAGLGIDPAAVPGRFAAAFVRGRKPASGGAAVA